jgi:mannose-6-phosphate isomerase-like protein (cupin superfamily)
MEVIKPWGKEIIWSQTDKYCGKFLEIKKGHRLSLQYHVKKEESIYVLEGVAHVEYGTNIRSLTKIIMKEKDVFYIYPGLIHRFSAPDEDVILLEVSTSELDDVVRLEDDYGRKE